ncbi:MAG: hypothetical protein A2W68_19270 [Betaproteobacteria bacterium RIFCSPLOWO2_02_64_14]|nr:MAG: hypothetical protein A2W68_19270 [Betaproteobacteria bacterium RIFCSPLOWO2_02_64_14]
MAARTLADRLTESALEELAGDRYFERGLEYFRHGAVSRLRAGEKEISARVRGSRPYAVRLWLDGRELDWDCTCPLGRDGECCKHLAATGLAWLAGGEDDAGEAPTELQTIRAYLDAADRQNKNIHALKGVNLLVAKRRFSGSKMGDAHMFAVNAKQDFFGRLSLNAMHQHPFDFALSRGFQKEGVAHESDSIV